MLLCIAGILCISISSKSQILKDIGNRVKQKTQQRANQKIDQAIDKGLDKAEDAAKNKDTSGNMGNGNTASNKTNTESSKNNASSNSNNQTNEGGQQTSFKTYSKFDFVPGDKVLAFDDFSQDAIGDFPVTWNTNSSAFSPAPRRSASHRSHRHRLSRRSDKGIDRDDAVPRCEAALLNPPADFADARTRIRSPAACQPVDTHRDPP